MLSFQGALSAESSVWKVAFICGAVKHMLSSTSIISANDNHNYVSSNSAPSSNYQLIILGGLRLKAASERCVEAILVCQNVKTYAARSEPDQNHRCGDDGEPLIRSPARLTAFICAMLAECCSLARG